MKALSVASKIPNISMVSALARSFGILRVGDSDSSILFTRQKPLSLEFSMVLELRQLFQKVPHLAISDMVSDQKFLH